MADDDTALDTQAEALEALLGDVARGLDRVEWIVQQPTGFFLPKNMHLEETMVGDVGFEPTTR